jgi:hypothetical protein
MNHLRRVAAAGGIVVAMSLALTACGGDEATEPSATAGTGAAATGAEGSTDESAFPEGTFEHTATVEEAVSNGFTEQESKEAFGPDGELPITFVFEDGTWQHIVVLDDGTSEVGDNGTYTVEGDELVTISESDGCPGCVGTYRWTWDGQTLGLVLLGGSAGEEDEHDVRLHTEYEFEKAS